MISEFAEETTESLLTGDIAGPKKSIRTFVKGTTVRPGRGVKRYTVLIPEDRPIGRADTDHVSLDDGAMSSVRVGGPQGFRIPRRQLQLWFGRRPTAGRCRSPDTSAIAAVRTWKHTPAVC